MLHGDRVKKRRLDLGLSTTQVAVSVGVRSNYITMLELGNRENPTLSTLERLAAALRCRVGYLLGETEEP